MEQDRLKKCSKCQQFLDIRLFSLNKCSKDGYDNNCKLCKKIIDKKYNNRHKNKISNNKKAYYIKNRDIILKNRTIYIKKIIVKEKIKNYQTKYQGIYKKNKRKVDIGYNLHGKISNSIFISLKQMKNGKKWEKLVGYSLQDLKSHIESKFTNEMRWDLFLKGNIHIDHIIPKEIFEYQSYKDEMFKLCWGLNNLQPLWAEENLKKSDYLENGKRARFLSKQEKLQYLKEKGYDFGQ